MDVIVDEVVARLVSDIVGIDSVEVSVAVTVAVAVKAVAKAGAAARAEIEESRKLRNQVQALQLER